MARVCGGASVLHNWVRVRGDEGQHKGKDMEK